MVTQTCFVCCCYLRWFELQLMEDGSISLLKNSQAQKASTGFFLTLDFHFILLNNEVERSIL